MHCIKPARLFLCLSLLASCSAFGQSAPKAEFQERNLFADFAILAGEGSMFFGPLITVGQETFNHNRPGVRSIHTLTYMYGGVGAWMPNIGDFGGRSHGLIYEKRFDIDLLRFNDPWSKPIRDPHYSKFKRLSVFVSAGVKGGAFYKDYNWLFTYDANGIPVEIDPEVQAFETMITAGAGAGIRYNYADGSSVSLTPFSLYYGYTNRTCADSYYEYSTPLDSPDLLGFRFYDVEFSIPLDLVFGKKK